MKYNRIRAFGLIAALLALVLAVGAVSAQDGGLAKVRFVHAIPGAGPIDVYVDGQLTAVNIGFGSGTTYANLPAGPHTVTVTGAGSPSTLWEQSIDSVADSATTMVAASAADARFTPFPEDLTPLDLGEARLNVIHAIPGAPAVDLILANGAPVIPGVEALTPAGTIDAPVGVYDFAVVPTGSDAASAQLTLPAQPLNTGTSYMMVVYGTASEPRALALTTATNASGEAGFVRVIHGVPGAPAVDVYVGDVLAFPSITFGQLTEHVAVPAGTYRLGLRAAGSLDELVALDAGVEAGTAVTVAALQTTGSAVLQVFTDEIGGIDAAQARLNVMNGVSGSEGLDAALADGTSIADGIAFGESVTTDVAPSAQGITLTLGESSFDLPAESFYGGVYYNLLAVLDGGNVRLLGAPTSLAQGISSAPGAGAVTVGVQPTPPPTAAPVEPTVIAVQPTVPPPTPVPAAPAGPTGRVFNMDPDRNLQLRQYPDSNALSLGTVPPGTLMTVNGRAGQLEPIPNSATPVPPDYVFEDPAASLGENEDLLPENTWLNVTFTAPDGGTITAWANALFVDVRRPNGDRLPLRELPLVPANQPGETNTSSVLPPQAVTNRVTITASNLDAGVNLNIRRAPDSSSEVLARVPTGTIMELTGINEAKDWLFVSYNPPEGGNVTGWINIIYATFSFNGRAIDLAEIEERGLAPLTNTDVRGTLTAGAAPAAAPTRDVLRDAIIATVVLNPGANLNLRRSPDVNAEVIARLPSGTQVPVLGRTEDGRWLNVSFETVEGWIAANTETAEFVELSLNGRPVTIADVPLTTGEIAPVPGVGPTATPTEQFERLPAVVTDAVVAMTGSPGGGSDGLPILSRGQAVTRLFTDGTFSYIELPDGTRGWVPAGAIALQ
jgi:SH3-like domain-containing protein